MKNQIKATIKATAIAGIIEIRQERLEISAKGTAAATAREPQVPIIAAYMPVIYPDPLLAFSFTQTGSMKFKMAMEMPITSEKRNSPNTPLTVLKNSPRKRNMAERVRTWLVLPNRLTRCITRAMSEKATTEMLVSTDSERVLKSKSDFKIGSNGPIIIMGARIFIAIR